MCEPNSFINNRKNSVVIKFISKTYLFLTTYLLKSDRNSIRWKTDNDFTWMPANSNKSEKKSIEIKSINVLNKMLIVALVTIKYTCPL